LTRQQNRPRRRRRQRHHPRRCNSIFGCGDGNIITLCGEGGNFNFGGIIILGGGYGIIIAIILDGVGGNNNLGVNDNISSLVLAAILGGGNGNIVILVGHGDNIILGSKTCSK